VTAAATERVAVIAAAALAVLTAARWRQANWDVVPTPIAGRATRAPLTVVSDSALGEAEESAVMNDPFRLSNSPPEVRYDPANDAPNTSHASSKPSLRPMFALKAIVGGPPWHAVIDGIPGQPPGTITQQGSEFDKLVVRLVTRDSVIIKGPDTSWVLRFGRQP